MQQYDIIELLSFEEILSQMKEKLVSLDPSFTALKKSDPAIKILEVASLGEIVTTTHDK